MQIDHYLTAEDLAASLRRDVRAGLTASPKVLPPKYFYDGRGSELFEAITRLPEYYQTRAEATILGERADDVADLTKARTLVELGSGSSEKTHLLLRALREVGSLETYVPVDVSEDAIAWAMPGLVAEYPGLERARHRRRLRATPRPAAPRTVRGWWRSSAAPSATSSPSTGPRSWPRSAPPSSRATRCCSAPTWSRTPTGWCGPTTTPPGSPPTSTSTCCA